MLGRMNDPAKTAAREIKTLRSLCHPHNVIFLGFFEHLGSIGYLMFPATPYNLANVMRMISYLVQPFQAERHSFENTETTKIHPSVFFTMDECMDILRRCFVCLSQGLGYLHRLGSIHGDIKPENILVDESGTVLFTDFSNSSTQDDQAFRVRPYTHKYAAPEVKDLRATRESSDIWSLGCVSLEIAILLSG